MLKDTRLKDNLNKLLLAFLYASAFYLSVQIQATANQLIPVESNQQILSQQTINILPVQEQNGHIRHAPVNLFPCNIFPEFGINALWTSRSVPLCLFIVRQNNEKPHSIKARDIAYRYLRI
ncbi:MAG: hypothetical protein H6541_01540 [Lentimicrobiaceae bacterium]|nr:hypothetical protein [Lentimicrobiaceae bacterium]MCB9023092.1 hypothetical protein [Lentimicrobiaceae bacterium]MCO5264617.1 hypothetical protein [Lentimicrobium sp.]